MGPNIELLAAKRKQQELEEQSKLAQKQRHDVKKMSEEERAKRLREMEINAQIKDEIVLHRQRPGSQPTDNDKVSAGAEFIRDMRSVVYDTDSTSMEDRLSRNRQYSQRSSDMDSHGFMKK